MYSSTDPSRPRLPAGSPPRPVPSGSPPGPLPPEQAAAAPRREPLPVDGDLLRLLQSAVLNSYDSIMITDPGTPADPRPSILFVNAAFTQLSGYTAEEAVGRSPGILQGPGSDPSEIGRFRAALAAGHPLTSELVNYRKDGTPFHVEARIMPIRDARGQITHWVGVQRDVTERKHAEEERLRLEGRLREKQKIESLGILAGGIAHDFNNLLTIIMGNASLARLEPSPDAVEQHLQLIESASVRAADLCRQMLAYSGQGRYVVRPVDLNSILRETVDLARSSATATHSVRLDLDPCLPPVMADAGQLLQVAMNLLINAAESMDHAPGQIVISTRCSALDGARLARTHLNPDLPAGDYVVLEVADSGSGIAPEIRGRIFDPFFTTKFTGRGLGLAAVLGIVRSHKGAIDCESEPGHGTRFRVYLPATASASPPC